MTTARRVALPSQQFPDRQANELQRQVSDALRAFQALPWGKGAVDLGDVKLSAATLTKVPHKLSRPLVGWCTYALRPASITLGTAIGQVREHARDAQYLSLSHEANVTFGLLVW